jgi:hypothetical protein
MQLKPTWRISAVRAGWSFCAVTPGARSRGRRSRAHTNGSNQQQLNRVITSSVPERRRRCSGAGSERRSVVSTPATFAWRYRPPPLGGGFGKSAAGPRRGAPGQTETGRAAAAARRSAPHAT